MAKVLQLFLNTNPVANPKNREVPEGDESMKFLGEIADPGDGPVNLKDLEDAPKAFGLAGEKAVKFATRAEFLAACKKAHVKVKLGEK
jgi:hypothetical protein